MQELPDSSRVIYLQLKDWFPASESTFLMHVSRVLWETVYEPVERSLLEAHRLLDQYEVERGPGGEPYHVTERIVRLARHPPDPDLAGSVMAGMTGRGASGPARRARPSRAFAPAGRARPSGAARTAGAAGVSGSSAGGGILAATMPVAALAAPVGGPDVASPPDWDPWTPLPPAPDTIPLAQPRIVKPEVQELGQLEPQVAPRRRHRRRRRWHRRVVVVVLLVAIALGGLGGLTVRQADGYPNGTVARLTWRLADVLPPVQSWLADQVSGLGWRPDPANPAVAKRARWLDRHGHWTRTVERVDVGSPAFCSIFPNQSGRCRAGELTPGQGPVRPGSGVELPANAG